MKRCSMMLLILLITLIITSCVPLPELTLKEVDVYIVTEEELGSIKTGEGLDEVLFISTVIQYKLVLENLSRRTIGSSEKPIYVSIEYEKNLIPSSIKLGERYRGPVELGEKETSEINISYDLMWILDSRSNENVQHPSQELLNELESKALDAIMVVGEGERELVRINLQEYKD